MIDYLLELKPRDLRDRLGSGCAIDPKALTNSRYRGVSLGAPAFIEKLTWKTFEKTFCKDPVHGTLRGWNVRLEQTGLNGPVVPMQKKGKPFTFGHYKVLAPDEPVEGVPGGLMLDYGQGGNSALDPVGLLRDPLVSLQAGNHEWLLGGTWVALGFKLWTPFFFALQRIGPLQQVVQPPRG